MGSEFDVTRYMGRWYEVVRDQYIPFEVLSTCVNADYTLKENGTSISVHNKGYNALLGWKDVQGAGVQSNVTGPSSLVVDFRGQPSADKPGNYNVVHTDYDTYAIVYSCQDYLAGYMAVDFFWILAREQTLSDTALLDIIKVVNERIPGYDFFKNHQMTTQGDKWCPYEDMPEANEGTVYTAKADYFLQ